MNEGTQGQTEMLEHRAAFVQSLLQADPYVRKRIFDTLEKYYAQDFENGRAGRKVYDVLYSAVRDADEPDALKEFENRFLPLLKRAGSPRKAKSASGTATGEDQTATEQNRRGGWAGALCAGVLVVGGLAVGLVVLDSFLPNPPMRAKLPVSAAQVADPIRTITEVEPAQAIQVDQARPSEQ